MIFIYLVFLSIQVNLGFQFVCVGIILLLTLASIYFIKIYLGITPIGISIYLIKIFFDVLLFRTER